MSTTSLDAGHKVELIFNILGSEYRGSSSGNLGCIGKYHFSFNNCLAVFIGTTGGSTSLSAGYPGPGNLDMHVLFDSTITEDFTYHEEQEQKYWSNQDDWEEYEHDVIISTLNASDISQYYSEYLEHYPDLLDIIGDRTIGHASFSITTALGTPDPSVYLYHEGDTTSKNGSYYAIHLEYSGTDIYLTEGAIERLLDTSTSTNVFNPISEKSGVTNVIKNISLPSDQSSSVGVKPFRSYEDFTYTLDIGDVTTYDPIDGMFQFLSNFASDGSGGLETNPFIDYSDEEIRYKADWTINIDGTKNPTIAVHALSPLIENGSNPNYTSGGTLMHLYAGKETYDIVTDLGYYAYGTSAVYSWKDIGEKVGVNGIDKLARLIDSELGQIVIMGRVEYEDGEHSNLVGCKITYFGEETGTSIASPSDGSTITVTYGATEDSYTDYDNDIDEISGGDSLGGTGLLTQTYVVTSSQLQQLGAFLWEDDFLDNFKPISGSPIENIISVKAFPYKLIGTGSTEIYLGNIGTGVNGSPIGYNYNSEKDIGSIVIPSYYNSFLDYAPYTEVNIFLPYIGFQTLDAEEVIGHTLSVKYFIDVVTGQCMAAVYSDSVPISSYSGQIGLDIPIMATNRAQIESGLISGALSTGLNLATGNIMGAVATGAKTLIDAGTKKYSVTTVGSASPACFNYMSHDVFVIIDRPTVQYPSNYNHTYGKPCNLTRTLGNLSGFTTVSECDLSGITCSDSEKIQIMNYLKGGVIL